jgi:protein-export membrane protein SecD
MLRLFLLGWLSLAACCNLHDPVGVVLVYEVDKDRDPEAAKVPAEQLLAAVQRRLRKLGEATASEDGKIEVRVYGKDATAVRSRLEHAGSLEFRIVADRRDDRHRGVIALAEEREAKRREGGVEKSGAAESNTVLGEGSAAAQWVNVVDAEAKFVANPPEFVLRNDAKGRRQVLVMLDPYNVTGDYFTSVSAGADRLGKPCIQFEFNSAGAVRFGKLTGSNVPDAENPDDHRCLAIILDRQVLSAPAVRSRIDGRGEITGNFTEQQAEQLAVLLSTGALPAPLRLVEERPVAGAN